MSGSGAAQSRPLRRARNSRVAVTRRVSGCAARRSGYIASLPRALARQCGTARTSVASRPSPRGRQSRHRSPPGRRIPEPTLGLWAQPAQLTVLVRCVRGRALKRAGGARLHPAPAARWRAAQPRGPKTRDMHRRAVRLNRDQPGRHVAPSSARRWGSRGQQRRTLTARPERACPARHTQSPHCSARGAHGSARGAAAVRSCARRAAYFTRAARLPARRTACGSVSGSFAAHARTRCAAPRSPPPPVAHQRRAARFRSVKARGRFREAVAAGVSELAQSRPTALTTTPHAAGFLRAPLTTAPLVPAR